MILEPSSDPASVKIVRGPNIGDPPSNAPLSEHIKGVATVKVGDKITTDHIMPAGSRLKYRSNIPRYSEFVFEREAPQFSANALENQSKGIHNIIIAGESYGQGSSREHAAICPMYLGVKMVIAKSMERIHRANLVNFGIVPAFFENPADYDSIQQGDELVVENIRSSIAANQKLILINKTSNKKIPLKLEISPREIEMLLAGSLINATKNK
jgi:aconitate hydratase